MKLWLPPVALIAVVLAASACGGAHIATTPTSAVVSPVVVKPGPVEIRTVSSSRLIEHGTVRCTASVTTPVKAGRALDASFTFRNVSGGPVAVQLAYAGYWLVVKSSNGTTYDTRVPFQHMMSVPYVPSVRIPPHGTETRSLSNLRIRWSGPLRITPGCGTKTLPTLRVAVSSPGAPANGQAALASVVAAAGHLLDHCRPKSPNVSVVGRIDPPSGNAPPLSARCSIGLEHERGFDVAQVMIVTPPGLRGVHLKEPYELLVGPNVRNGDTEAIAWQFVVTRSGATSVYSAEIETMHSGKRMAPDWVWTGSKWQGPGGSRCGGSGEGFGGITGPDVSFVSVCR